MPNMDRRQFLKATGISLGGLLAFGIPTSAKNNLVSKPNILFIYADQFRRQALGFWSKPEYTGALNGVSDPVITPTLDKLADEGIVFNQAVSTYPVCSPYRGMLLSGMFPNQNGITQNCYKEKVDELKHEAVCITDVLSKNGYNTAYFGKTHWHKTEPLFDTNGNYIGSRVPPGGNFVNDYDTYIPPGPSRHNIEYWYQALKDAHKDPYIYSNDPKTINDKTDGELFRPQIYSPLNEANHIINYLNNTRGQRSADKPFCIFWALNPPHSPYSSTNDCDEDAYNLYYKNKTSSELLNRPNVKTPIANLNAAFYFANVTGVDKQVGRVLDVLASNGLKENTIVVFTSDHGEMMGSQNLMSKNIEYEESFGVPFLISYPKKLSHRVENLLLGTTDIFPTLLGLADLKSEIPKSVQGKDYSSLLLDTNTKEVTKPKSAFYMIKNTRKGVRTDKYTFTVLNTGAIASLYNNIDDPYQLNKLDFNSLPEAEKTFLLTELGNWLAKANDEWFLEKRLSNFIIYPDDSTEVSGKDDSITTDFALYDNYPNPFNPETVIKYTLAVGSHVTLKVFDVLGKEVATLVNEFKNAGTHHSTFNAPNSLFASGVYLYKLQAGSFTKAKKMLLMK